jgi:hypothetical protein
MFLFYTERYFPLPSPLLHQSRESKRIYVFIESSAGNVFAYGVGGWGLIPNEVIIIMSVMPLKFVKYNFLFKFLHSFVAYTFIHNRKQKEWYQITVTVF